MKALIIGGGGREHALAWKTAQSRQVDRVYVAPGNAGTATEDKLSNVDIDAEDIDALRTFAQKEKIALTIIGPEVPLVSGCVDAFRDVGLACFGPTKVAAMLEGSKAFSKDFLTKYQIPTAGYRVFDSIAPALEYIDSGSFPLVIKADGLAAGKGVVITSDKEEAVHTVNAMLSGRRFGEAGRRIVIEEFLEGEETSFIVMVDGEQVLPLASSQDYKARDEGDKGPNTGGMGACSPAPIIDQTMHERIMNEIIMPTVRGMIREDRSYSGFLYAGIMIGRDGAPKVLEFNCRCGDPETQVLMMRLKSDLFALCLAATQGRLSQCTVTWDPRVALGIVMASAGYPESAEQGAVIHGLDTALPDNVRIFHAGTLQTESGIITAGGRVLCVAALDKTFALARQQALAAIDAIHYEGIFYRQDIAYHAIARTQ